VGQKANPNIIRLNTTNDWSSFYTEKKLSDFKIYTYKDVELKKFIDKYFQDNQLIVQKTNIYYSSDNLIVEIFYFPKLQNFSIVKNVNKDENRKTSYFKEKKFKYHKKTQINEANYQEIAYIHNINNNKTLPSIYKKNWVTKISNLLRFPIRTTKQSNQNLFIQNFLKTLKHFTYNKFRIKLVTHKLNYKFKTQINNKTSNILKRKLIQLRRYEQNTFFKEGLNIFYLVLSRKNCENLLAYFLATQLKLHMRHNFFLRFVKTALTVLHLKTFSILRGIKIKISGRFNKAPRARSRTILIGTNIPNLTLDAKIHYAESTAYTAAGTFGVKVWLYGK